MDEDKRGKGNSIILVIIILLAGYFFWQNYSNKPEYYSTDDLNIYTTEKRDNWELSLYSSENPDTYYLIDNIKGFATKDGCISE